MKTVLAFLLFLNFALTFALKCYDCNDLHPGRECDELNTVIKKCVRKQKFCATYYMDNMRRSNNHDCGKDKIFCERRGCDTRQEKYCKGPGTFESFHPFSNAVNITVSCCTENLCNSKNQAKTSNSAEGMDFYVLVYYVVLANIYSLL